MKFSITLLVAALYLFSSVKADISTTSPFATVVWNGGEPEQVTWNDDGKAPTLSNIKGPVTIQLMAGGSLNQVFVANISTIPSAVIGQVSYNVPKDVGPPGNFYFIKYIAGEDHTAFSGTFSIQNVNGVISGFDPNNPNGPSNSTTATPTSTLAAAPTQSSDPYSAAPTDAGTGANPYGATDPAAPAPQDASSGNTPASTSTPDSASNTSTGLTSLPSEISFAINNLVPSFASVATAVIALTFTYLY